MLLDAALLTLIVALLAGGRLSNLSRLDLRAPWLFAAAAAVQIGVMVLGVRGVPTMARVGGPLHIVTYVLLIGGLWANRHLRGVWVAGLGVLLNCVVLASNGGAMPVDRELAVRAGNQRLVAALESPSYASHKPAGPDTRLRPLADVLPLPMLVPRPRFFSPGSVGDVLVTIGVCWLLLEGLGAFGMGPRQPDGSGPERQESAP